MRSGFLNSKYADLNRLPEPYCHMEPRTINKDYMSVYNEGQRLAEANGIIIRAALEYFAGNQARTALVKVSETSYATEAMTDQGILITSVHTNGRVRSALRKDDGSYVAVPAFDAEEPIDTMPVLLGFFPMLREQFEEVSRLLDHMQEDSQNLRDYAAGDLYKLSDSIYRIFTEKRIETDLKSNGIAYLDPEAVTIGGLRSNRVLCGAPSVLAEEPGEKKKTEGMTVAEAKEEFAAFAAENEWTKEEEQFIPVFEEDFLVPEETLKMARRYVASRGERRPMVNFMWRGITAYGKSTGVEIMACILHMPLLRVTCNSNMETQDFLSDFVPNTNTEGKSDAPRFMHVESNYVKALERGYIVEVQEISRIKDSGVLVGLNEYDRAGAMIPLVDGTYTRRHKRALVVYTDNVGYNSCRPIDASVIRRMSFIIDSYDLPKEKTMARLELNTGVHNQGVLEKCYQVWRKVRDFCYTRGMTDGSISLSELEMWVLAVKLDGYSNFRENCIECVVSKATNDIEEQEEIISSVLDLYL
ncbi:MAG: hypothetical protein E7236_01760 [Lachnospiraceae bacterium]|nr:hypothetical protein [Lachnospiraceae bacterium]